MYIVHGTDTYIPVLCIHVLHTSRAVAVRIRYVVGIGNPSLSQLDLKLTCGLGVITKIEEVPSLCLFVSLSLCRRVSLSVSVLHMYWLKQVLLDPNNTVGPHTPGYFPTGNSVPLCPSLSLHVSLS